MKLSGLKSNAAASETGRWVKDIPGMEDAEFFVRGTNTPAYRRRMQALIRALPPSAIIKGTIDPVQMDRITGICLADCALTDWKNVDDDGAAIPYSAEKAKELLTDPDMFAFRDGVLAAAQSVAAGEEQVSGEIEGNSAAPSVTA